MNPIPTPTQDGPLRWHDGLLLGYQPMDDVHHEFVTVVSALQNAGDADPAACLDAVVDHARRHFDDENRWMEETQFPARQCHIDEHAAVMASLHEVQQLAAKGDTTHCRPLAKELARWLPGHADYLDSALAHWMCKQRLGGKPVVIRRDLASHRPPAEAA